MSLSRRNFLEIATAAVAASGLSGLPGVAQAQGAPAPRAGGGGPQRRLNLLIVTADDLNADSMGWMGSRLGATPHLDALAAASRCFVPDNFRFPCRPEPREKAKVGLFLFRRGFGRKFRGGRRNRHARRILAFD